MHINNQKDVVGKQGMVKLPATILARVGVVNGVSEVECKYVYGDTQYVYSMFMTRDFTVGEHVEKVFPMKIVGYVYERDIYMVLIGGQIVKAGSEQIIGISEEE
ncbi:hypothetical protein CN495_07615 [Bacillus thuringiensis]|uniref:Uncharacterized protein n=1 Tax=Bacillus thuringiensis TaxID=1428 RepID=A0ABD6S6Z9_BACTU|nr:hypothetical protein [Bacillus thuringiensis]PER55613.1 hypothetical protein CN495_07615 [Bacillus thuringiensis]